MNQLSIHKKRTWVTLTLLGAILMGLVWLVGASGSARAQGTLLLETSYKDATPKQVGPGGTVAYTVVLHNSNLVSATTAIVVNDPLTPQLSYVSFSARTIPEGAGSGYPSGGGVQFEVKSIAAGGTVTLSFQATVATTVVPGDVITNTATITENGESFTRAVAVTIEDYPSAQITEPWNNQLFTNRGVFTIKGRAWNGDNPGFPKPPVLSSIVNGGTSDYAVVWSAVPDAFVYVLQESTSPYFTQIRNQYSVSGVTSKYIEGQPNGVYYYRVKVRILLNSALVDSLWSGIQSATVGATGLLAKLPSAEQSIAPLAVTAVPTVEINIKKVGGTSLDNWLPVTTIAPDANGNWWNWTYAWTLPTENDAQYTIQVRAKGPSGYADPTKIHTITVNVNNGIRYVYLPLVMKRYPPVPYAPVLNVASNNTYGTYQLSWVYSPADDPFKPTSYTFQEATESSFTTPTLNETWPSATLSRSFAGKVVGTYYYRVRGNNAYGAGPWSNVQTIVVNQQGFLDDFSNVASGWPRTVYNRGSQPDGPLFDVNYENGSYRAKIMLNVDGRNNRRMGIVPAPYTNPYNSYDISVEHRFAIAGDQAAKPELGKGGLVFAANSNFTTIFVVEWNFEGDCAVTKYTNTTLPTTIINFNNITYLRGWGKCVPPLAAGYDKINTAKVTVEGNRATVYLNNSVIGTFTDSTISGYHKMGLVSGSWDRTPVESRFDNFKVTPK